jgi:hypothetical protein
MAQPTRRVLLLAASVFFLIAGTVVLVWPLRTCPNCGGFTISHNERTRAGLLDHSGHYPCMRCDGRGRVSVLNEWLAHP